MHQLGKSVGGVAFALLLCGVVAGPAVLEAQVAGPGPDGRWPLQPASPGNNTLAPFAEGWYENPDGTYSLSFGYVNTNLDTLYIPVGENNSLDQAQFDGVQAAIFFPGRHRGVFSVTLSAEMKDTDVWWTLVLPWDRTTVPGRVGAVAYQLDWMPRAHGSVTPSVSFESQPGVGRGPPGILAERTQTVAVGSPLTLSVNATDTSERDLEDSRNTTVPLRVVWSQLQGPGPVTYTRHESNPLPEAANGAGGGRGAGAGRGGRGGPQTMRLPGGSGTASVIVTFPVAGEYLMLAQVDNFDANDSGSQDQCCWTNAYVRVNVTP